MAYVNVHDHRIHAWLHHSSVPSSGSETPPRSLVHWNGCVSAAAAVIGVISMTGDALQPIAHDTEKHKYGDRQLQTHALPMEPPHMMHRSLRPGRGGCRALCIGLGGGSLPNFLSHHFPGLLVDAVELDPLVVTAATDYMGFPSRRCLAPLLTSAYTLYAACHMSLQKHAAFWSFHAFCSSMHSGRPRLLVDTGSASQEENICVCSSQMSPACACMQVAGCAAYMICCSGQTCKCIRVMLLTTY